MLFIAVTIYYFTVSYAKFIFYVENDGQLYAKSGVNTNVNNNY